MTFVEKRNQLFLSEQGIGGVVQFPQGFLKKAYELVRMNGGVCIADEVCIYFCNAYCLCLTLVSLEYIFFTEEFICKFPTFTG
jgi:hypothetical protein